MIVNLLRGLSRKLFGVVRDVARAAGDDGLPVLIRLECSCRRSFTAVILSSGVVAERDVAGAIGDDGFRANEDRLHDYTVSLFVHSCQQISVLHADACKFVCT